MTKKQILNKLNKMASADLDKNYKAIMSMACDYNDEHYGDDEKQIFVADVDDGIAIEYDYYFFKNM